VAKYDVTKLNVAIDQLIAVTQNPRHRFLLQAYSRHRYLEVAGRYEEIFAPDMTVQTPVYHFYTGGKNSKLEGLEVVKSLYRMWAETNQSIAYIENEQVAVANNFAASTLTFHQQVSGKSLALSNARVLTTKGIKADENAMYLYSRFFEMVWPYDDRGRLIGEDIWEADPDKANIVKLDPADVLTTAEAAKKLAPLIKPLPSFDELVLSNKTGAG
jgi:hypothetical protein